MAMAASGEIAADDATMGELARLLADKASHDDLTAALRRISTLPTGEYRPPTGEHVRHWQAYDALREASDGRGTYYAANGTLHLTSPKLFAPARARAVILSDATGHAHEIRRIYPGARCTQIKVAHPPGMKVYHIPTTKTAAGEIQKGAFRSEIGALEYALSHLHFDGPHTLHITHKAHIENDLRGILAALTGPAISHNGTQSRGSNAHEHCDKIVTDSWHVPSHAIEAEARNRCHIAGGDWQTEAEVWRYIARYDLEIAPVIQGIGRSRWIRKDAPRLVFAGDLAPSAFGFAEYQTIEPAALLAAYGIYHGKSGAIEALRAHLDTPLLPTREKYPQNRVNTGPFEALSETAILYCNSGERLKWPNEYAKFGKIADHFFGGDWQTVADALCARVSYLESDHGGLAIPCLHRQELTDHDLIELAGRYELDCTWIRIRGQRKVHLADLAAKYELAAADTPRPATHTMAAIDEAMHEAGKYPTLYAAQKARRDAGKYRGQDYTATELTALMMEPETVFEDVSWHDQIAAHRAQEAVEITALRDLWSAFRLTGYAGHIDLRKVYTEITRRHTNAPWRNFLHRCLEVWQYRTGLQPEILPRGYSDSTLLHRHWPLIDKIGHDIGCLALHWPGSDAKNEPSMHPIDRHLTTPKSTLVNITDAHIERAYRHGLPASWMMGHDWRSKINIAQEQAA
jgi:hypothetical protein